MFARVRESGSGTRAIKTFFTSSMRAPGLGRPLRELVKIAVPRGIGTKAPLLTKGIMKRGGTGRKRNGPSSPVYAWNAEERNYTENVVSSPSETRISIHGWFPLTFQPVFASFSRPELVPQTNLVILKHSDKQVYAIFGSNLTRRYVMIAINYK